MGRKRTRAYNADQELNMIMRKFRVQVARSKGRHTDEEWQDMCRHIPYCVSCGSESEPLTKDHIVPIYAGGSDSIGNLQPMCRSCNSGKSWCPHDERPHPLPVAWQLLDTWQARTTIQLPDLIACRMYISLV